MNAYQSENFTNMLVVVPDHICDVVEVVVEVIFIKQDSIKQTRDCHVVLCQVMWYSCL